MKKSKFSEEQVAYALREVEGGRPVADVCRQMAVSEATFYVWKKKYGHLGVTELRRLRHLEDENNRLKRLVADRTLAITCYRRRSEKKSEAHTSPRAGALVPRHR
jgi:putative transposase